MKLTFALNTCTKSEEMKRSKTTEALFSQVNRGAEAFFCIYESKSRRAQSSVQISVSDSRRSNYDVIMLVRVMKAISVV